MASKSREKDQAMAARLKADGVKRDSARCPICSKVLALNALPVHIAYHPV
jgi:hypothetical protein